MTAPDASFYPIRLERHFSIAPALRYPIRNDYSARSATIPDVLGVTVPQVTAGNPRVFRRRKLLKA